MSHVPRIPGYQLLDRLGAGGMGVVYAATRHGVDAKYAIKMLLKGWDASIHDLARFRIEAEAYACLKHDCIIKIRDVGIVSGCPYLVMDFAENGSLEKYLKQKPDLDITWRVQTIRRAADALAHAHGRRILHRDLKPANILISADGTPRVTDFGLVKFSVPVSSVSASCCTMPSVSELDQTLGQLIAENRRILPVDSDCNDLNTIIRTLASQCADRSELSTATFDFEAVEAFLKRSVETRRFSRELLGTLDDLTQTGAVMGSPQFMSPEQAKGLTEQLGPQTDVYGLGATLYYVLTGRAPVTGKNAWEIVRNVPVAEHVPVSTINNAVSEELSLVVMKAIETNPENRYPNMEMFGEDLDRVLNGRPPLARLNAHVRSRMTWVESILQTVGNSLSTIVPGRPKA